MVLVKTEMSESITYERLFEIINSQSVMVRVDPTLELDPPLALIDTGRLKRTLEDERVENDYE